MMRIFPYRITKHLGSGQFGTVSEGVWQSPKGPLGMAVKMVTTNSPEEEKVKLLQEAAIMGQFGHPNVVQLHGVVTVGEPVSILCSHSLLYSYILIPIPCSLHSHSLFSSFLFLVFLILIHSFTPPSITICSISFNNLSKYYHHCVGGSKIIFNFI